MPRDSTALGGSTIATGGPFRELMEGLPESVRNTFSDAQVGAIRDAVEDCRWGDHPVDVRLSLPLPLKRYYMVLLAGLERRDAARRARERVRRPVLTLANALFLLGLSAAATAIAAVGFTAFFSYILLN